VTIEAEKATRALSAAEREVERARAELEEANRNPASNR
jgi:hypothetical protein